MDIQVQELINKIKKDGLAQAEEESSRLIAQAEKEAHGIIERAKKEAHSLVEKAKKEADRFEAAGKSSLEQASRNLMLEFKAEVQNALDLVVNEQLEKAYTTDVVKAVLPDILKNWVSKNSDDLAAILPEASLTKLKAFFKEKLAAKLKKGFEIKGDASFDVGFRIAEKDGSAYYDFSQEAVAALLGAYLNPQLAEVLKKASSGKEK